MKKIVKRIGLILGVVILVFLIINFQTLIYGIEQAKGQLKIIYDAEPISEILKNRSQPDSIIKKLEWITEVKKFAEDSLGINKSKNYETFYDQKGKPAIWVVTASPPFELKSYEWSFPFLGKFSYKGFFNQERAIKEEKKLKKKGYDTEIGNASGWSTLGWFKDPILSGMLKRKEGSLANLIIHELTHGTLYIKDSVDFNENLASFIGDKGAIKFLKQKYGEESDELKEYQQNKADREKFIEHILSGATMLEKLYVNLEKVADTPKKISNKKELIKNIILSLDTVSFHNKKYYSSLDPDSINNTFFLDYKKYHSKQENFEEEFTERFHGNLKEYLLYLKNKYPSL